MALNIIEKEKKEIRWRGLPNSDTQADVHKLEQEIQQLQERIQKKKEYFQELEMQRLLYSNLIDRNTVRMSTTNNEDRIYLPFIVIHTKKDTSIECEMSEDRKEYFFDFSLPFSIYDDNEILKRMGLSQPLWKIENTNDPKQQPVNANNYLPPNQPVYQIPRNTNNSEAYTLLSQHNPQLPPNNPVPQRPYLSHPQHYVPLDTPFMQ